MGSPVQFDIEASAFENATDFVIDLVTDIREIEEN